MNKMQIEIDGQSFDLNYMLFNKNKLIRLGNVAKDLERDSISMFKTSRERHIAVDKLCALNRGIEELYHNAVS